jgi:hypothetical protein
MKKRWLSVFALVLFPTLCFAVTVVTDQWASLTSAAASVNAANVSGADATDLGTAVRPRATHGDPYVEISPSGSVQHATACFEVILYQRPTGSTTTTYQTIALVQTVTFDGMDTISGRYVGTQGNLEAKTLGCQVYDVRVRNVSSGNVNWYSWTVGASSAPAGQASE